MDQNEEGHIPLTLILRLTGDYMMIIIAHERYAGYVCIYIYSLLTIVNGLILAYCRFHTSHKSC